jgi:hypothetical protein
MWSVLSCALRGTCLLAAVATAGLWVRSHSVTDSYRWRVRGEGRVFERVESRSVEANAGRLVFRERTVVM